MPVLAFIKLMLPRGNHAICLRQGVYTLEGKAITPTEIMRLDAEGQLEWTHGHKRELVAAQAIREQLRPQQDRATWMDARHPKER